MWGVKMKRRKLISLIVGSAIACSLASYAQQPNQPLKRVGILAELGCPIPPGSPVPRRLSELGWIEGQNLVFECVSAVGLYGHLDQLAARARELVSRRPDVLLASPIPFIRALKQETTTIPIVMLGSNNLGLVTNLARPEGNVTGVIYFGGIIMPKRIEILKEIVPRLGRLALLAAATDPEVIKGQEATITIAASQLGFAWQRFQPVVANDYDEIFARLAAGHFDAAYIVSDPLSSPNIAHIAQLALRHLIPTIGEGASWVEDGLLLGYAQDYRWTLPRASEYVDKILRGAKPGDLPVEQATTLLLTINLKTAKALGLTVSPSLLARAEEVIE
jgi:putative ABC transport system substrate-binding protein